MTAKQNPVEIDAMNAIMHSAQLGVPFETYMKRVADYGRKRIRMIQKGLGE